MPGDTARGPGRAYALLILFALFAVAFVPRAIGVELSSAMVFGTCQNLIPY